MVKRLVGTLTLVAVTACGGAKSGSESAPVAPPGQNGDGSAGLNGEPAPQSPEAQRDELARRVTDLEARLAAITSERDNLAAQRQQVADQLAAANAELETLRANGADPAVIAAKEQEIATLRGTLSQRDADITALGNSLTAARAERDQLAANLGVALYGVTQPVQGLWQLQTQQTLVGGDACRIFVQITGAEYRHALVCDTGTATDLRAAYSSGVLASVDESYAGNAADLATRLVSRRFAAKGAQASCVTAAPLGSVDKIEWKPATKDFIAVTSGADVVSGLFKDDPDRDAETCEQILSRPNRTGLEKAVRACRLFAMTPEELAVATDLGCFAMGEGGLTFERAPLAPLNGGH